MTPLIATAPSYPISIFMAGLAKEAGLWVRGYCDDVGFCVTVTETRYVYRGGFAFGIIVGLINYPRFPLATEQLWTHAEAIGELLCKKLKQDSFTIQAPDRCKFYSNREQDAPQALEARRGETGTGSIAEGDDIAVREADAPAHASPTISKDHP